MDLCSADWFQRAGETDAAQQSLERAQGAYLGASDATGRAACLMMRADWLCAVFNTPLTWNFRLQDLTTEYDDRIEPGQMTLPTAEAIANAQSCYAEAENLFQQSKASRGLVAIQLRYGYLGSLKADYDAAAQHASLAINIAMRCGDWRAYYIAQTHLSMASIGAGRFHGAVEPAQRVGAWGNLGGSFSFALGLGILLGRFGRAWFGKGDYERALASYRAAQALFQALDAPSNAAQSIVDRADVYAAIGERSQALGELEQAMALYEEDQNARPQLAVELSQRLIKQTPKLYYVYSDNQDPDGIQRCAERLKVQLARISENAATTTWATNEFRRTELNDLRILAQNFIERATRLMPLFRKLKTLELRAEERNASDDPASFDEAVLNAAAELRQLIDAMPGSGVLQSLSLGSADEVSKSLFPEGTESARLNRQFQATFTHTLELNGKVIAKDYTAARAHIEALEQLAGNEWWARDPKPWEQLDHCAATYEGLGDMPRALGYCDKAIEIIEARRRGLTEDQWKLALAGNQEVQRLYFRASRLAMKMKDDALAFRYAERGKARALLDLMAASGRTPRGISESGNMRRWRELRAMLKEKRDDLATAYETLRPDPQRIKSLTESIAADEAALSNVEAKLEQSDPNFYRMVNQEAPVLSLDEVKNKLPKDTALLQFVYADEDLLAWVIDHKGLAQSFDMTIDRRSLDLHIRSLHRACRTGKSIEPFASQLAEIFLVPCAQTIRSCTRLLIVPYGEAYLLPFHALPFEGESLAPRRAVSYLPSASVLQFLRGQSEKTGFGRMLAIGNPDPTRNLPYAAREAALVASLFDENALLGGQATEEAVRERIHDCAFVHFATHGTLSNEAPLASSILLANGDELTVYELMGLHLNAELVVLSACDTGRGQITGGDDVLGFTRALLATGAKAALVSLWPVNDVSTSLFMGAFYRYLREEKAPSAALQRAQQYLASLTDEERIKRALDELDSALDKTIADLSLDKSAAHDQRHLGPPTTASQVRNYSHPYHWAPFILVG